MKKLLYFILIIICISCTYYDNTFPYNFQDVTQLTELDGKMQEISGLFYKNENSSSLRHFSVRLSRQAFRQVEPPLLHRGF